jgi:HPt (histidine-containing phosphotransfer) domain-containing protein
MEKVELTEKLYDLTMVLSVSGGDESFIKKMVALFVQTVPKNVDDLVAALKKEDWDQVSKLAHKLKSTIDSMGINSLKTVIREVEAFAKQKELLEKVPALVEKIVVIVNKCIEQLEAEMMK